MKKRRYIAGLVIALSLSMIGCGKNKDKSDNSKDSVTEPTSSVETATPANAGDPKSDLLYFVNYSLPSIESKRTGAIEIYNSYFESETLDIDAYKEKLKKEAVPMMKEYVEALSALEVKTEEVELLRQEYLDYANKQYKALRYVIKAIDERRKDFLTKADTCIKKAETSNQKYLADMAAMAEKYGVEVSGYAPAEQLGSATDVEAATEAK